MRVLLFAYSGNNKSYYSAKHNHKLEQIRVCDHRHQLLPFASPALTQPPSGSPVKSIILFSSQYTILRSESDTGAAFAEWTEALGDLRKALRISRSCLRVLSFLHGAQQTGLLDNGSMLSSILISHIRGWRGPADLPPGIHMYGIPPAGSSWRQGCGDMGQGRRRRTRRRPKGSGDPGPGRSAWHLKETTGLRYLRPQDLGIKCKT